MAVVSSRYANDINNFHDTNATVALVGALLLELAEREGARY
jgi:hypothetical protein